MSTFRQQAIIDKLTRVLNPSAYEISFGRHGEPALVDNGKIERIAEKLLRGPHQPKR